MGYHQQTGEAWLDGVRILKEAVPRSDLLRLALVRCEFTAQIQVMGAWR